MIPLSICIPTWKGERYIAEAIRSVLAQTWADFELIVCDDGSPDGTLAQVRQFNDPRLRVVAIEHIGMVENWNYCIELAQGKYIAIFHQDDIMFPENLALKMAMLELNPRMGFVFSNIQRIDHQGIVFGGHWNYQPEVDCIMDGTKIFELTAEYGNIIACPSVIMRKECYTQLGVFNPKLRYSVDLEMWMRVCQKYEVGYIAKPLIGQRSHPSQETGRFQGTGKDYQEVLSTFDLIFSDLADPSYARYSKKAYRTLCRHSFAMAKYKILQKRIRFGLCYGFVSLQALIKSM